MSYLKRISNNRCSAPIVPRGVPVEQESIGVWADIMYAYEQERKKKTIAQSIKQWWAKLTSK